MSATITYLIYIDGEGDVRMLKMAKGVNPDENSVDANGWTLKYYYYEIADRGEWMETHYWNFTSNVFVSRDRKPNKHATWVGEAWTWDADLLLEDVRTERNALLWQSDWTQNADSPLTDAKKTEWATYRTALRNIPSNLGTISSVDDVTWPTKPS